MAELAGDVHSVTDEDLVASDDSPADEHISNAVERAAPPLPLAAMREESPPRNSRVRAGDVLGGKYCVERVREQGPHGVEVEVQHLKLGQRFAIKLLLAEMHVHPEAIRRFSAGARFAAQLRSEHVARVIDVGTLDSGAAYVVTEQLTGTDLRGVLRVREYLPVTEAVDYTLQACEALAEAHAAGFVHRNLKLSNLFLARRDDGRPIIKVLDFCVSDGPLSDVAINLSSSGAVLESLGCLAPEQLRDPSSVDARADIWALGAILHELVTGEPPFSVSTAPALIAAIAADPVTPAGHVRSGIPIELEAVLLRALERERDQRWTNLADFVRQLAPFASAEGQDSIERILLRLDRRLPKLRSTVPPPLPGAVNVPPPPIVHVGPPSDADPKRPNRRIAEIAAVAVFAVGIVGACTGIGAFVAVRNFEAMLAARPPAEKNLIASLSPALPAPPATQPDVTPQNGASQLPAAPARTKHALAKPDSSIRDGVAATTLPAAVGSPTQTSRAASDKSGADPRPGPAVLAGGHGLFDEAN